MSKSNINLGLPKELVAGFVGGLLSIAAVMILSWVFLVQTGVYRTFLPNLQTQITVANGDVSTIVEQTNPAVVSIVITKDVPVVEQYFENPFNDLFGGNSPFFNFQVPRYRQNGTEKKEVGGGSGFIISDDGYIVTNAHVVQNAQAEYTVFTNSEVKYNAEVVAVDEVLDIALLKIDATGLSSLSFGNSDVLKLGEPVIAIGNALGEYRNTVSTGVISGLSRSIVAGDNSGQSEVLENVIQTDAAINPGNSGGPLLNLAGEVIGINVAVARGSENIAFALPANTVKTSVESMKQNGRVIRPYLGVRYTPITASLKEKNKLSVDYGVIVLRGAQPDELAVIPGSPADKAGIVENDILIEVDGVKLDEEHSLSSLIRLKKVGDTISIKLLHKGEEKTLSIKLEEMPN